jgi:hypothetical protein
MGDSALGYTCPIDPGQALPPLRAGRLSAVQAAGSPSNDALARVRGFRRCWVRDRLQPLGGRAEEAHNGADVGAPGPADVGAGAPPAGGDGAQQLRAPVQDQGGGGQRGRVLRHVGLVEDPRREVLPLDRRVPAVGSPQGTCVRDRLAVSLTPRTHPQPALLLVKNDGRMDGWIDRSCCCCCCWHADPEPAAGAAGGGAAHAGGRPAAHVDAGGGRAVAGHGEAAAEPRGDPYGRGRPVRAPRRLHAADGHRGGHTERAGQLRDPGKPDR